MKKIILFLILILGIVLISGCTKPQVSSQILVCRGIYTINGSVGFLISTDEQAFNILKEGRAYDTQNNTVWVEDRIPSDMSVNDALQEGLLKSNQDIELKSGETVSGVWMLAYKDKAIDKDGNLYLCDYTTPPHERTPPSERKYNNTCSGMWCGSDDPQVTCECPPEALPKKVE